MNVVAILRQKGRAVTTAAPTTTLLEIADKLSAKRIGAIVVVGPRGEVAGIISERDIIRALAARGADCLTSSVAEVMTKEVVTCQEADTLDELMAMMTARRIISIGDVVKHHVAEVEREATAMRDYIAHS
jgi:CBS domain-containing protein